MASTKEEAMFEREIMIAGLRKEHNALRELIENLEDQPRLRSQDAHYCDEVLKRVETTLRKLRRMPQG
jgi:ribosome assembly protein YihI (activator of Der GTPase)